MPASHRDRFLEKYMAVTQQGSRAGLITTIVILSIVSVIAIILAFWHSAEKRNAEAKLDTLSRKYKEVIPESALSGTELNALRDYAKTNSLGDLKPWDILVQQRNGLVKVVDGKEATDSHTMPMAVLEATSTLAEAAKVAELPAGTDNLSGAVKIMAGQVAVQKASLAERDKQVKEATGLVTAAADGFKKNLADRDAQVTQIRGDADKAVADAAADRKVKQDQLEQIEKDRQAERQSHADLTAKKDVELAAGRADQKKLQDRLNAAQAKFDKMRISVTEPILRHGDGKIIGFSGKDIITINLGQGAQLVPGTTFEVYDKNKGIPKVNPASTTEDTPAGKASVEVVAVGQTSSECRVTRLQSGAQLVEGDIIFNVVYDPTTKYNFYVFGKFDLDRNKVATAQEADIIRKLINQWGGKLVDQINVDTDFLVIGREPVVPDFNAEELTQPENIKKRADAEKDVESYRSVVLNARELHIPILNQNRFLHFTGSFDMVMR